ncbi:MAG: glycosyltransferase family 1 protein [Ferruginibacter sp.]
MPRFAAMLVDGMKKRGHKVEVWTPGPFFFKIPLKKSLRKWLGYVDQYIIFPFQVKSRLRQLTPDRLFVFTDQALGPWIPMVAGYPHVIHCHDFLAQRSALGDVSENKNSWTGKKYQDYIRRGFRKGKNFISVSENTRTDLQNFLEFAPVRSEVIYNGLNQSFFPGNSNDARISLGKQIEVDLTSGYILHVGGNQWYKNRKGVIEIYAAWRKSTDMKLPLLMVGGKPVKELMDACEQLTFKSDVQWLWQMDDEQLQLAYKGASVFLFPSLAEGFGWPIAEAMASGCPVITTNEPPMTEVSGTAGFFVNRRPADKEAAEHWAVESAEVLEKVLMFSPEERQSAIENGLQNASRFNSESTLDKIEEIYAGVLSSYSK